MAKVSATTTTNIQAENGLFSIGHFSADGLRSRTFFENPEKSPFLHGLIRKQQCTWVFPRVMCHRITSWARSYDGRTLNRSNKAWMWGSPDIVSIFVDTLNPGVLMRAESYSSQEEDFATENAARLDEWVFDKVETYFSSLDDRQKLDLNSEKAIFFLHLIGLDTNGHGKKPKSANYIDNIATVDTGVQKIVEMFESTFIDHRTAYLFTADHGMTDWGSHGAGTDDEILTPLLVWGAGVKNYKYKQSLNQVDLAPLQSSLLGLAVPVNSMGILPIELLDASPKYKFFAAYGNFKQMLEQYGIRRAERLNHSLPLFFQDYPGFGLDALEKVEAEILRLAKGNRFDAAATACMQWIPRIRDALMYFHRYQRFSLGLSIVALYVTWNLALFSLVTRNIQKHPLDFFDIFAPCQPFVAILCFASFLVWLQHLQWTNYLYYLMPIYTVSIVYNINFGVKSGNAGILNSISRFIQEDFKHKLDQLRQSVPVNLANDNTTSRTIVFLVFLCLISGSLVAGFLLTLVSVFFERSVLSVIFVCLSPIWIISNNGQRQWNFLWLFCCLLLAVFPQLDTVGSTPRPTLVVISPFKQQCYYNPLLILLHVISGLLNAFNLLFKSLFINLFAWSTVPLAFLLPMLSTKTDQKLVDSLVIWFGSLFLPFCMLTTAYESIFLVVFSVFLLVFVRLEIGSEMILTNNQFFDMQLVDDPKYKKEKERNNGFSTAINEKARASTGTGHFSCAEWRRAVLLVALIEMAFFGTGNIASLNSFNTSFLLNFTTVFSPFLMAGLLLFKISIPFLQLAVAFATILHYNPRLLPRLSVLMMLITDCMAVIFFYLLKDEGSWLDIGLSISNYVICLLSSIIVFVLLHLAYRLLVIRLDYQSFIRYIRNLIN
uniref:GPI ethanolamine phosphate transferase 1 n=1 Tax=Ditylenchus dipsaci TaxID=166011 RepID=A0A915ENH7_9BILA